MRFSIREEADVSVARTRARQLAVQEGFPAGRAGAIATAVSEVAWNIVVHAGMGEVLLEVVTEGGRRALVAVARDGHPGIADVEAAMRDGHSTGRGLGLGLPSARRLVDEFEIRSAPGDGTTVTLKKWAHDPDE
jgi:serine/threonine-protein kinase RsbT